MSCDQPVLKNLLNLPLSQRIIRGTLLARLYLTLIAFFRHSPRDQPTEGVTLDHVIETRERQLQDI
jgi:hypothetical protein